MGYEPNVDYFFGFPRAIEPGGVSFDIPLVNISAVSDGDVEKKKQFTQNVGIISSALEHATPEQMFTPHDPTAEQPNAISAVKALQIASSTGQRTYHITPANMASTLPAIHHDSATLDEIRASLNAGKEVITHTDAVSVPGWTGAGYIILDPVTGEGAYKISGGGNGGVLANIITIGLLVLSIFPASIVVSGLFLAIILFTVVVLNAVVLLDSVNCGGSAALGLILLFSVLAAFPFKFVETALYAFRTSLSNWISTNSIQAALGEACP